MIGRAQICACTLLDSISDDLVICEQIYGKREFSVKIRLRAVLRSEVVLLGLFKGEEMLKIHVNVPLAYTDHGSYQRQETRR